MNETISARDLQQQTEVSERDGDGRKRRGSSRGSGLTLGGIEEEVNVEHKEKREESAVSGRLTENEDMQESDAGSEDEGEGVEDDFLARELEDWT